MPQISIVPYASSCMRVSHKISLLLQCLKLCFTTHNHSDIIALSVTKVAQTYVIFPKIRNPSQSSGLWKVLSFTLIRLQLALRACNNHIFQHCRELYTGLCTLSNACSNSLLHHRSSFSVYMYIAFFWEAEIFDSVRYRLLNSFQLCISCWTQHHLYLSFRSCKNSIFHHKYERVFTNAIACPLHITNTDAIQNS